MCKKRIENKNNKLSFIPNLSDKSETILNKIERVKRLHIVVKNPFEEK